MMGSISTFPALPAPPAAVTRILARYNRPKLEAFIAIAIDLLDTLDGDPDDLDAAWPESSGVGCPGTLAAPHEDDEDDDPAERDDEDRCSAGDDMIDSGNLNCGQLMCLRSDKGIGDADDGESDGPPVWPLE